MNGEIPEVDFRGKIRRFAQLFRCLFFTLPANVEHLYLSNHSRGEMAFEMKSW